MSSAGEGAVVIDGRALASEMLADTQRELAALRRDYGRVPGISVVMIGDDPASGVYARRIIKTAERVGAPGELIELQKTAERATIGRRLRELSADDGVGGVIVQLPLPSGMEPRGLIEELDPAKDLDGIHPYNAGLVARGEDGFVPSCAEAAVEILRRTSIPIAGRSVVIIGRSNVVGRPAELLLLRESATITVCHRQTRDLSARIAQAEIVVVAAGSPGLVRGDAVRPGAVVIDCGITVMDDGSLAGDVDMASVRRVAGAMTPVPGGVGPVTNAVLMAHLARAARRLLERGVPEVA